MEHFWAAGPRVEVGDSLGLPYSAGLSHACEGSVGVMCSL